MSFPKYEAYKDSGVEWLGEVPKDWKISRVKFDSYVKARVGWHGLKSDEFTDVGPYLVTGSDFQNRTVDWKNCYHCTIERYDQDRYIQLQEGDLLVTKDGTIGKLILVQDLPGSATLNSGIFVIRPLSESYSTQFFFWLLQSSVFYGFINIYKTGSTIGHLYQETFENLPYALPLLSEQVRISQFLDHEIARIDALIAEQKHLIALLKEKRQAVISHAVTKGLDPAAPMKDSNVEWLGEVPKHWSVSRIKYLCSIKGRIGFRGYTTEDQVDEGEGALVLGATHITTIGKINIADPVYLSWEKYYESPEIMIEEKDVLVVQRGSTCGKIGFIDKDYGSATINPSLVLLKDSSFQPYFIFLYLSNSIVQTLFSSMVGSTAIPMLSQEQIGDIAICVPSVKEQQTIISYVESVTKKLDGLIAESIYASQMLRERRSALISAAVTGKIDVRNWQPSNNLDFTDTLEVAHG